jgi:hypothetical protein
MNRLIANLVLAAKKLVDHQSNRSGPVGKVNSKSVSPSRKQLVDVFSHRALSRSIQALKNNKFPLGNHEIED